MLADYYLSPISMVILILICITRWIESVRKTKDIRGLSAIASRLYLLYLFGSLAFQKNFDVEVRDLLMRLGIAAVFIDEAIYWISSLLGNALRSLKRKLTKHG